MKYLYLETYKDFKCIGSDCPFTCCGGGWRIKIDSKADAYYKTVEGEFGERLNNNISRKDGISKFILTDRGDCPFLNKDKLCDIYINLGEEHLCSTCTLYPRYSYVSGDIVFSGVSISCPVVARFLMSHKEKLQIDYTENDSKIQVGYKVDWESFNQAVRVFTSSVEIAQNRKYSVRERLAILTLFLYQYQSQVDEKKYASGIIDLFNDESYYDKFLPQTGIYQKDLKTKVDFCVEVMKYFGRIETFGISLPELADLCRRLNVDGRAMSADKLLLAFNCFENEEEQIWQEQLLTYVLFRYFMQGLEKGDYYNQFMIGMVLVYWLYIVVMVLYYQQWDKMPEFEERVLMIAHISRLIEHDGEFRDEALENFCKEGMTDPFFILKLIS